MQFSGESRPYRGCDHWNGSYYCGLPYATFMDEVTEEQFCAEHAGPLSWSARDINLYSLALKVCGARDVPYEGKLGRVGVA